MSKVVVARDTCVAGYNGRIFRLYRGQAWAADDPFVKARPELFTEDDRYIHRSEPAPASKRVERATRRPGERRA